MTRSSTSWPRLFVVPVAHRLARGLVVVVALKLLFELAGELLRARPQETPDGAADEGHRVLGRDRVVERRGVKHPLDAEEPGGCGDLGRDPKDPVGIARVPQARPHVDEHRVHEPQVGLGDAGRVLPPQVEREAVDRLAVGAALEALQDHHRGDDRGRDRASAARREQVLEQLVGKEVVALSVQKGVDRRRVDHLVAEAFGVVEQIGLSFRQSERHGGLRGRELPSCNSLNFLPGSRALTARKTPATQ